MKLPSINYYWQIQGGRIQDGWLELKTAISQSLLNPDRWCSRCYGSIDAMDSVKVPYVICLANPIWRHPRWRYPKWRPFVTCCLAAMHNLSKQLHSTTTLEGNGVNFIFTTRQPLRIQCPGGRRPPNVYEFATISDWCTDGWHITKLTFDE